MKLPHCYEILELDAGATREDAVKAYRDMAAVWHPDRHSKNPRLQKKAGEKIREINQAYQDVLAILDRGGLRGEGPCSPDPSACAQPRSPGPFVGPEAVRGRRRLWPWLMLVFPLATIASAALFFLRDPPVGEMVDQMSLLRKGLSRMVESRETGGLPAVPGMTVTEPQEPDRHTASPQAPEAPKKIYEIHMNNGAVILTRAYRIQGDMVYYHKGGGTLGISRSQVREIREP